GISVVPFEASTRSSSSAHGFSTFGIGENGFANQRPKQATHGSDEGGSHEGPGRAFSRCPENCTNAGSPRISQLPWLGQEPASTQHLGQAWGQNPQTVSGAFSTSRTVDHCEQLITPKVPISHKCVSIV